MSATVVPFRPRGKTPVRPFALQGSTQSNSELYDGLVAMSRLRAASPETFAAILKMARTCVTHLEEGTAEVTNEARHNGISVWPWRSRIEASRRSSIQIEPRSNARRLSCKRVNPEAAAIMERMVDAFLDQEAERGEMIIGTTNGGDLK